MTRSIAFLRQPPTLLLGRGMRNALPAVLPYGVRRALFVTDNRVVAAPEFRELTDLIEAQDISVQSISSVRPDCPAEDVIAAARTIKDRPDVIVAVGGGSVIDFGKTLAVLLTHGGEPDDYYGEFAVPGPTVPVVALPTTAGTGSEATPVAVVTDAGRALKVGISSPFLIPIAAICDPELTDSAPAGLTAHTGADALSHCVEAFTAIRREITATLPSERVFVGKSDLVDRYALEGIRMVGQSLRIAVAGDPDTAAMHRARDGMAFAALAGGLALGTAGTAAAHALQYPVGALTHTAHGLGVAVLMPYVMQFNRSERIKEFAQIALALGAKDSDDLDMLSWQAIDRVSELFADIGIPKTLADLGVDGDQLAWVAEQAYTARRLVDNNPKPLSVDALADIAGAAHSGDMRAIRN